MRNQLLTATALMLLATPAMAQTVTAPQIYGSVGYSQIDANGGDFGALTGRVGAKLTPHIGVEGEGSFGVSGEEKFAIGIPGGATEHKYDLAAYVVGFVPLSENFELFGRVGYGMTEFETKAAGSTHDRSADGVSYGVGANYFIDGQNGVRGDWTRRDFGDDGEADVWSISYIRRF